MLDLWSCISNFFLYSYNSKTFILVLI